MECGVLCLDRRRSVIAHLFDIQIKRQNGERTVLLTCALWESYV